MRISSTLLALALAAAPLVTIEAETIIERMDPHPVELDRLLEQPTAYMGMRVRFTATFVQTADLFDTYHTGFTPEQFLNLVVWDDDANIWDPEVRAAPVTTLYYSKQRDEAITVSGLGKYVQVEVVGAVVSDFDGEPWIDCHEIVPDEGKGRMTDNDVYHVQRGTQLASKGAYDLADGNFEKALEGNLPYGARVAVLRLRADNLLNGQEWVRANEVLDTAISVDGDNAELHYMQARALSEMAEDRMEAEEDASDEFESAVAHARTAIQLDPEMGDAYAVLGISLAGLQQFDAAKQQCERAIRLLPDNAEVRWYLGRIHNRQEEYTKAIEVLKEAIDRAPKDYRLHKTIAASYYQRGLAGGSTASQDIETALREYDIAIRLEPDDADLFYFSGLVLETATEREQQVRIGLKRMQATYLLAIERFETCVSVDDTYTDAHVHLGARYRHEERHDEAVTHYKRALELEPERDELYGMLGRYMWDLGRREEAYAVFLGHHERNEDYIDTIYALGRLSLELDKDERAVEWLNQVLRLARDHAMAHADLTESYFELGEHRRAERHAEDALELLEDENQKIRVHRFAGLAQWAMDEIEETVAHLDGRVEGAEDIRLPIALGWALSADAANAEKVVAMGKRVAQLDPEDPNGPELVGWGQYLAGNYSAAEAVLKKAYQADQDNDILAYRLGMAIYQQGAARYDDAKPLLEQGEDLRSRKEILDEARGEIRDAQRAIRDHEREVARQKREAEREAKRKAREKAREKARQNR